MKNFVNIDINEVGAYFFTKEKFTDELNYSGYPVLAPAFDKMSLRADIPNKNFVFSLILSQYKKIINDVIVCKGDVQQDYLNEYKLLEKNILAFSNITLGTQYKNIDEIPFTFNEMIDNNVSSVKAWREILKTKPVKWKLKVITSLLDKNDKQTTMAKWDIYLDEEGKVINNGKHLETVFCRDTVSKEDIAKSNYQDANMFIKAVGLFLHVGLTGLALMHCKNVKTVEVPKKHNTARNRHTKNYVVNINPLQTKYTKTSEVKSDIHKNAHICRGHFKDYRQGKGLFGRTKGLFWFETHAVIGNAEPKNYNINGEI